MYQPQLTEKNAGLPRFPVCPQSRSGHLLQECRTAQQAPEEKMTLPPRP